MSTVFDHAPRTSIEHKRASQPIFDYWNSSARPGSEVSRALIEDWFSRFPTSEQDELRSRFLSGDVPLAAAFHELCLHELLVRQACKITVHPTVAGSSNRPDFKVVEPDGLQFLLEARSSTEVNTGPEYSPRYNRILDFLRTHDFDGFLLGVDELTTGKSDLSQSHLQRHIASALSQRSACENGQVAIPPFESDGWRIRLKAFPRASFPNRTELVYLDSSRTWTGPSYPLLRALKKKAGRYGSELSLPLVLSISSFDPMLTDSNYNEPFGQRGFWGSANHPQNRRVSAVLLTNNLWPETLLTRHVESRLYLNPFAHRPYRGTLEKVDTFSLENDSWRRCPGKPLCELLELPRCDFSLWD